MSDKKFAGYICTGCGIGERLDTKSLEQVATREGKMNLCRQHPMLCSKEGVELIRNDIANEGVTHVMLAACSRRAKVEASGGINIDTIGPISKTGVDYISTSKITQSAPAVAVQPADAREDARPLGLAPVVLPASLGPRLR